MYLGELETCRTLKKMRRLLFIGKRHVNVGWWNWIKFTWQWFLKLWSCITRCHTHNAQGEHRTNANSTRGFLKVSLYQIWCHLLGSTLLDYCKRLEAGILVLFLSPYSPEALSIYVNVELLQSVIKDTFAGITPDYYWFCFVNSILIFFSINHLNSNNTKHTHRFTYILVLQIE